MTLPDCVVLMTIGVGAATLTLGGAGGAAFGAGAGTVTTMVTGVGAEAPMTVAPGGAVCPGNSWTYWIGRTTCNGVALGPGSVACG